MSTRSLGTLTLDLIARTGLLEQGMDRAARKSEAAMGRIRASATSAASALGNILGIAAGTFAVGGFVRMADEWGQINARLKLATQSTNELQFAQKRLLEIADRTYRSYGEAANQFANSARSLREFGIGTVDALDASEALSLALVAGASGAQESTAAMNAFSRAAAQGVIDTRQLQTILTQTPRVAQALAEGLNTSTAGLVEMARNGELLMSRVIPGMNTQLAKLRAEVESMPATVADAMGRLSNAMLRFFGVVNDNTGATQVLVRSLERVAENFDAIARTAVLAGAALAGPYLAKFLAGVRAVTAAQVIWLRTTIANTAALRAQTVAAIAATAALTKLRAGLSAVVGGPVGAALIAISAAWMLQARSIRKAREELDEFTESIQSLKTADLGLAISDTQKEIAGLQGQIDALSQSAKNAGIGRFLERQLKNAEERMGRLTERAKELIAAMEPPPTQSEIDESEAQRLAALIRLQVASNAERERAREIIRQTTAELEAMTGAGEDAENRRIELAERRRTLEQALEREQKQTGPSAAELMRREADAAVQRLEAARAYGASAREIESLMGDILAREAEITAAIEARGGPLSAEIELLREGARLREVTTLPTVQLRPVELPELTVIPRIEPGPIAGLDLIMQQVRDAQAEFDLLTLSPSVSTEALEAAEQRLDEVREAARRTLGAVADYLTALDLPGEVIAAMLERIRQATEGTGIEFDGAAVSGSSLTRVMATMARGALNLTRSLGSINRELSDTLSATVDLVDAWDQMQEAREKATAGTADIATMISGVMGIAGGLAALGTSIVGMFSGESEAQRAQREALERNIRALDDLRASLDGFRNTLGLRSAALETLTAPAETPDLIARLRPDMVWSTADRLDRDAQRAMEQARTGFTKNWDKFQRDLESRTGRTLAEWERIAREQANGFQLLDKNGFVVAGAFGHLAEALEITTQSMWDFGSSFADAQRMQSVRNRIFELDDTPMQRLQDSIALLGDFSEPLGAMFAAINLSDADGRDYARDLLQRLYVSAEAGLDSEFGALISGSDFESLNEFFDSILGISDGLDGLREETEKLTASLTNVPTGFRLAQRQFEALAAGLGEPLTDRIAGLNDAAGLASGAGFDPGSMDEFIGALRDYAQQGKPDLLPQPNDVPRLVENHYHFGGIQVDARERPVGVVLDELVEELHFRSRAIGGSLADGTTAIR